MAIFSLKGKKDKYSFSRIPHGDFTVEPYVIRPYTSSLQQTIDQNLNDLLFGNPKCVDSQNGDVLDKVIDCWKDRAKNELEKQKTRHLEEISKLASDREANLEDAQNWLTIDIEELKKLYVELRNLEIESEKLNKNMSNW